MSFEDLNYVELEVAYERMAQDAERESEALEWAEAILADIADEACW